MFSVRMDARLVEAGAHRVALSSKTVWHPLSLQQLSPDQFVSVVDKILDGRYELTAVTRRGASASGGPTDGE